MLTVDDKSNTCPIGSTLMVETVFITNRQKLRSVHLMYKDLVFLRFYPPPQKRKLLNCMQSNEKYKSVSQTGLVCTHICQLNFFILKHLSLCLVPYCGIYLRFLKTTCLQII
ncbi:unnamed protein product [Trichobilharzia szidati]|nr:unnamed protein product [Trichobilharzia szidati]